ncbi:MAG: motility protein A [Lentisphaerae bacterium]|nr:motility protein A [Lentisphaerota bacterium]
MDWVTIAGIVMAWGCLAIAIGMDGGELHSFLKGSAALLVFGGTIFATIIGFTWDDLRGIPAKLKTAFVRKQNKYVEIIGMLVEYAKKSRRDGILALEDVIEELDDKFMKKGLQLLVDGIDLDRTRDTLEADINALRQWYKEGEEFFKQLGGFSPTLGIIGTVLGLIHMMGEISSPESMGPAIAMAFIATMYGISSANLIYLPLSNKIHNVSLKDLLEKRIVLEGLLCIQAGISPRLTEEMLKSFVHMHIKEGELDSKKAAEQK